VIMPRTFLACIEEQKLSAIFFIVYDPTLPAPALGNMAHF